MDLLPAECEGEEGSRRHINIEKQKRDKGTLKNAGEQFTERQP